MFAYIGCYTDRPGACGKGISVYEVAGPERAWTLLQLLDTPPNPGCLAIDARQAFLYACHGDIAAVSAYRIDRHTGKLSFLNLQPTGGDNAPHLTIDAAGRHLIVAHGPGIAVFPISPDGSLVPYSAAMVPPGTPGPYRREQAHGAHPHQVVFDPSGNFLVAPDKGVDSVHVYRLDGATGKLVPHHPHAVKCRYGAGPRHIAFHPGGALAYVVNELDSTIATYRWDARHGTLEPLQILPSTPATFTGDNTASEVAVARSGRSVYVSNRGHDSIATFSVNEASGTLSPAGWVSTNGRTPRFFALEPGNDLMYVANEASNSIVALRVDQVTGELTFAGQVADTGTPTCIVFGHDGWV